LGDPPLCRDHYTEIHYGTEAVDDDDLMDVVDEIMDHPRVSDIFARFGRMFDGITGRLDRPDIRPNYRGPTAGYGAQWPQVPGGTIPPPRAEPPPPGPAPAPPPPPPLQLEDPRLVLGFPPEAKPTEPEIKSRRRKLAAIVHPDQGGSEEAMRRINLAADRLIEELWAA
jgi:hypothetical protein